MNKQAICLSNKLITIIQSKSIIYLNSIIQRGNCLYYDKSYVVSDIFINDNNICVKYFNDIKEEEFIYFEYDENLFWKDNSYNNEKRDEIFTEIHLKGKVDFNEPYLSSAFLPDNSITFSYSKVDYKNYLQTNIWNKKRKEILEKNNNKCQICECKKNVQVYHKNYRDYGDLIHLGNENEKDVLVMCDKCYDRNKQLVFEYTRND